MKVVGLISGGKDSCFAMMKCVQYGHEIVALANLMPADDSVDELDSYMYQTVGHQIVVSYSKCMGVPLFRRKIQGSTRHHELSYNMTAGDEVEDMFILLKEVKHQIPSITGVSSGAIASDYQRLRVESVCSRLGLISLAYLWKEDQSLLLQEMIKAGIVAITVKVAAIGLNPSKHLGKELSELSSHLHKLKELYGINVCGEGGEYETLTLDCPLFKLEFPAQLPYLLHIAMCSALCNESVIQYNPDKRMYEKIGESTEVALRVLAEKVGLPGFDSMPSALNMLSKHERASYCNRYWENEFKKISVLEFSRDRKMMSVLCNRKQMEIMFSKGAPESIISRCTSILCNDNGSTIPLTASIRAELELRFQSFAGKEALRCLALALKRMPIGQQAISFDDEKDLTFIGLVGMLDPPREEVNKAILSCMTAGIRLIVVTGDNKITAEALCRKIGAFSHLADFAGQSYTASEFEELPALQKAIALQRMTLFTRVEPAHKRMLVEALQHQNEVVAMTGDGVNDAPALKKADIGIAMGSGTAVAKSASDMVLADDNFASIVAAVAEGRAIYNNTKQFIRYMISSNIGEVVCIFVAAVLGIPDTLVPVQLLWVNLVTDGLPATAIGFNKQDSDVMKVKPRKVNEAVVTGWLFFRYLVIGAYVGLATVAGFIWWFLYSDSGPKLPYSELINFDSCSTRETLYPCSIFDDRHPSTVSMTVLVVVEMFNALNNLSENQSLCVIPPWTNLWLVASIILTMLLHMLILYVEPLSILFSVTPLTWAEWTVVLYLSFPVIIIDEILKFFSRNSGWRFNIRFRRADLLPKEARDK